MDTKTDHLVRKLRLRHLELLAVLSETATMRGAAARLHLSQPAVSKMLGEVEACFGTRLFERSHLGIHANTLGASAAFRARAVLNELAHATADVDALQSGAAAVLRIGAPSVTVTVPAAIAALRRCMPGTAVQVKEGRVQELIQRLLDGELDCVFAAMTPELLSSNMTPLLEPVVLLKDELCAITSSTNAALPRRKLRWSDLVTQSWMVPPKETLVRQAFMTAFVNDGAWPPLPVIEVMSSVTLGSLLRQEPSLLCAVRLEHAIDEVSRGGVRMLEVVPKIPLPSFGLFLRRDGRERSRALAELVEHVKRARPHSRPAKPPAG